MPFISLYFVYTSKYTTKTVLNISAREPDPWTPWSETWGSLSGTASQLCFRACAHGRWLRARSVCSHHSSCLLRGHPDESSIVEYLPTNVSENNSPVSVGPFNTGQIVCTYLPPFCRRLFHRQFMRYPSFAGWNVFCYLLSLEVTPLSAEGKSYLCG